MDLIKVSENALTLELDWADCSLLAYLIRHALNADALGNADNQSMTYGYAQTIAALLEAGGLASWAYTVTEEEYTLAQFRTVAPVTKEHRAERQAWIERCRAPAADDQPADAEPTAQDGQSEGV